MQVFIKSGKAVFFRSLGWGVSEAPALCGVAGLLWDEALSYVLH